MATTNKKPRAKRTQQKKCLQTICGMTCINKDYTCRDNDPNAKKKIRQKGKELVDKIQGKTTAKTRVDHAVEKAVTKPKAKSSSNTGKLAYEKLTKEAKTSTKRSKAETYNQGLAILGKYGGKDDNRTRVDRDVEKASSKTRRKPQTENEKTQKVLRREEAQRVIRELQDGEIKGKTREDNQPFKADIERGREISNKFGIEEASKEYEKYLNKVKQYEAEELKKINDFKQKIGKPLVSIENADIKPLDPLHAADLNYRYERSKYLQGKLNRMDLATKKLDEEFGKTALGQKIQKLRDSLVSRTPDSKEIIIGKNLEMQRESIISFLSLLKTPLSKPVYIMEIENGQREFSQTDGNVYGIAIKKNSTKDVVYHELAHILEVDRGVTAKSKEWVLSRAESKEPVPLGEGYRPDEKAYKGNFFHPYLGKVYSSDHTEVLSVSVQYLSDNSLSHILYKKDPELFYFAVANLN